LTPGISRDHLEFPSISGAKIAMTPTIDKESLVTEFLDGVFVCTKDGEILYSNPAFGRSLGYSQEKLAEKNLAKDLVERALEWKALVSLLEQGSLIRDYEIKFKRADGSTLHGSLSAFNLKDSAGTLIGISGILRDITTRKGVENDLREKAYRADILNKIAKLASTDTDMRRRALVGMCSELLKLVNFEQISVGLVDDSGRQVEVLAPDPDSQGTEKSLGKVPFEGSIVEKLKFSGNAMIADKDGGRKPYGELSLMDTSRIASLLCVPLVSRGRTLGSLNISHSKPGEYGWETADMLQMVGDQLAALVDNMTLVSSLQSKLKLQDSLVMTGVEIQKAINTEQIYAAIASNLSEVVPYTELSFYIIDWTHRMVRPVFAAGSWSEEVMASPGTLEEGVVGAVTRTGKAELLDDVDADPRSMDVPGVPQEHNPMLAIPLTGSEGVIGVLEIYRPRGQLFAVSDLEAGKLFAQQASVAVENAIVVSKLQEAKKEIEMLNDLMFHDINNYNFACLNYIEMIAKSKDVPAAHKVYLEKSLQLIRQTVGLIENVKKLTKIGVMSASDFIPVNLSQVLRKVVSGLENSFPGRSISVKLTVPDECFVRANSLVEELFVNILSNSVKYDPHDEVEVEIECERMVEDGRPFWKVCISDRGYGVPDDKKHLLFQKYVRLKPDEKTSGTGLGLSICRALVDKCGGRIWVDDREPGKSELGAKFCMTLPEAKEKHH